jgi:hypothetical protein
MINRKQINGKVVELDTKGCSKKIYSMHHRLSHYHHPLSEQLSVFVVGCEVVFFETVLLLMLPI